MKREEEIGYFGFRTTFSNTIESITKYIPNPNPSSKCNQFIQKYYHKLFSFFKTSSTVRIALASIYLLQSIPPIILPLIVTLIASTRVRVIIFPMNTLRSIIPVVDITTTIGSCGTQTLAMVTVAAVGAIVESLVISARVGIVGRTTISRVIGGSVGGSGIISIGCRAVSRSFIGICTIRVAAVSRRAVIIASRFVSGGVDGSGRGVVTSSVIAGVARVVVGGVICRTGGLVCSARSTGGVIGSSGAVQGASRVIVIGTGSVSVVSVEAFRHIIE